MKYVFSCLFNQNNCINSYTMALTGTTYSVCGSCALETSRS